MSSVDTPEQPNTLLVAKESAADTGEIVAAVQANIAVGASNGFHHADTPTIENGHDDNWLPEQLRQEIEQYAELDGFVTYSTTVVSRDGEVIKLHLSGTKNIDGLDVADIVLPLVVRVSGDGVVKVSKDYVNGEQEAAGVIVAEEVEAAQPDVVVVEEVEEVHQAPVAVQAVIVVDEASPNDVAAETQAAVESVIAPIAVEVVEEAVEEVVESSENVVEEVQADEIVAVTPQIEVTPDQTSEPEAVPTDVQPIPEFVLTAIEQVATKEGFTSFTTSIAHNVAIGNGFVGEISRVKIRGNRTKANGLTQVDAELSLVIKLPPANKFRREMIAMRVFEREVYVYNVLLPAFESFQHYHGLRPGAEGFYAFPKCYYAHFDLAADQAVLILEDLIASGFGMESKFKSLSFEYAKSVVEKLGQLHAISLAMKDQRPHEFAPFKEKNDVLFVDDEANKQMLRTITQLAAEKAVGTLRDDEANLKERVLRASELISDEQGRYLGELAEPYAVMVHGDSWVNNLMFKFASGHKLQLAFLDWQCTRYASPAIDLLYFIFLCTDAPLRAKHYDDLLQAYHHALRAQLDRLGADFNELFPFTALLRSIKQYGRYALGVSLMIVQMLSIERENLPDMDDMMNKFVNKEFDGEMFGTPNEQSESVYNVRMSGILRDLGRKGYL